MDQPINYSSVAAQERRDRQHREFMESLSRRRWILWEPASKKPPKSDKYLVMVEEGETVYMTTRSYNDGSGWVNHSLDAPYAWAIVDPIYPNELPPRGET